MLLYIINQLETTGSSDISLMIIYFISIAIAISVIVVKSPVVSILYLIGLFCTVAIYLIKHGMVFAGLTYLLVYVGAISILFIFIVMLLNVRISELLTEGSNSTILAIFSVMSIYILFSGVIPGSEGSYYIMQFATSITEYLDNLNNSQISLTLIPNELINSIPENKGNISEPAIINQLTSSLGKESIELNIASVSAKSWDISLAETSHISSVGNIFYTILIMNLIVVSFIILLAMIGAIVITVKNIVKFIENKLTEDKTNIPTNISTSIYLNS